jgi:phosphatidylglycerol---prolipoprotein diacylglyceryl transferase
MIIHNLDPVLVDFGLFQIRWYSLAYIFGIILSWIYINIIIKKITKEKYSFISIKSPQFEDLLTYLVLGIIFGGRLGYVLFYNFEYFSQNLLEIFKIWQGGMSFHGGLFGVIVSTLIYSKITKNNFFRFTDLICCAAPIGIFLGRIANFINGELYGKFSTLPWSVIFPDGGNIPRHPSQIYESILEGIILFILINFLAFKKKSLNTTGLTSGIFLVLYSTFRIISEIFREPDSHLGYFLNYFSMGTLLSLITLFSGFLIIFFIKKDEKNN